MHFIRGGGPLHRPLIVTPKGRVLAVITSLLDVVVFPGERFAGLHPSRWLIEEVSRFRGETDTIDKMEKRIEFDLEYPRNWSLRLDLEVILHASSRVLRDRRASDPGLLNA